MKPPLVAITAWFHEGGLNHNLFRLQSLSLCCEVHALLTAETPKELK